MAKARSTWAINQWGSEACSRLSIENVGGWGARSGREKRKDLPSPFLSQAPLVAPPLPLPPAFWLVPNWPRAWISLRDLQLTARTKKTKPFSWSHLFVCSFIHLAMYFVLPYQSKMIIQFQVQKNNHQEKEIAGVPLGARHPESWLVVRTRIVWRHSGLMVSALVCGSSGPG